MWELQVYKSPLNKQPTFNSFHQMVQCVYVLWSNVCTMVQCVYAFTVKQGESEHRDRSTI